MPLGEREMNESLLYLVRVWRHPGDFRASVRSVVDQEIHMFTEPHALAHYFATPGSEPPCSATLPGSAPRRPKPPPDSP